MFKKTIFSLFLVLILVIPAVFSLTAAARGKAIIHVNASPEDPAVLQRKIYVENRNEIPVKVTVYVDDKFVNMIDNEIILEPGESRNINYVLTIDRGGHFEIALNVGFESADPNVDGNKVGVPVVIDVYSEGPTIEDDEEEDEPVTPLIVVPTGDEEPGSFSGNMTFGMNNAPPEDDGKQEGNSVIKPLIGILIILIILGLGAAIFFVLKKK